GMSWRIMLMKKTEMARMVAAAGFTLKQENMKARLMRVTASKVMKKWTTAKRCHAAEPSKVLMTWSSGKATNRPPEGKNTIATSALNTPSDNTRTREKTAPASHFNISRRRREIGRHRIMR